jgi:acyl-CoA thioester hydrolase
MPAMPTADPSANGGTNGSANGGASAGAGERAGVAPTSGWTVDARHEHVFPLRVYYEDTDAGGIVYYVNYLKFAERARTEMLRLLGHHQVDLLAREGIGFTVRSCTADYLAPARLDDALEVRTTLIDVGGASMRLRQRILRDETLLCDLRFRLAVMKRDGRPARMPQAIREALEPHALGEADA